VALVKDFRGDIYQEFLSLILPKVIGSLDISNVELMDKSFTLLSFGVKYLTKSIKDDLPNFYLAYAELLTHKNKFIRKFSAQAFCYVIRKVSIDQALMRLILSPIESPDQKSKHQVAGVSELLFEVAYGAGEGLHSKAKEVLGHTLTYYTSSENKEELGQVMRCLFLKLVNEVDTEKHQMIYDTLGKVLRWKEQEKDLNLLLEIYQDSIKLKFGRRVSQYGLISITETFTHLLHNSNLSRTKSLSD
jgi:hypothetical protein